MLPHKDADFYLRFLLRCAGFQEWRLQLALAGHCLWLRHDGVAALLLLMLSLWLRLLLLSFIKWLRHFSCLSLLFLCSTGLNGSGSGNIGRWRRLPSGDLATAELAVEAILLAIIELLQHALELRLLLLGAQPQLIRDLVALFIPKALILEHSLEIQRLALEGVDCSVGGTAMLRRVLLTVCDGADSRTVLTMRLLCLLLLLLLRLSVTLASLSALYARLALLLVSLL